MSAVDSTVPETGPGPAAAAPAPEPTKTVVADPEAKEQAPLDAAALVAAPTEEKPTPELSSIAQLWNVAKANGHPEIWGVTLADPDTHIPTQIVLQKYLNANDGDVTRATEQLTKTLEWRAKMKPLDLMKKEFNKAKFGSLGYVTTYVAGDATADPESKEVFTWNIYGAVKNIDDTFTPLEQ